MLGGEPIDYIAAVVTAAIAYHGLTFRDEEGESEFVHLLFGGIALVFCVRFVFWEILHLT